MTDRDDPVRLLLWVIVAILGLAVVLGAVSGWTGSDWHWGGMMAFGPIFMLVPLLLVVLLVYALTDRTRPEQDRRTVEPSTDDPDALAVAKKRYAAGAIDRDEFLEIKEDIDGDPEP